MMSMSWSPSMTQLPGEHLQTYAWRVWTALEIDNGGISLSPHEVLPKVMLGLHQSVVKHLPFPPPATFDDFLVFGDVVFSKIPPEDSFWVTAEPQEETAPDMAITIENDYFIPTTDKSCHKCGVQGHFAFQCLNERVKSLRPNRKKNKKCKSVKRLSNSNCKSKIN